MLFLGGRPLRFSALSLIVPSAVSFSKQSSFLNEVHHLLWEWSFLFHLFRTKKSLLFAMYVLQWHSRWRGVSSSSLHPLQVRSGSMPRLYRCFFSWLLLNLTSYIPYPVTSDVLDPSVNMASITLLIRFSLQPSLLGMTTSNCLLQW